MDDDYNSTIEDATFAPSDEEPEDVIPPYVCCIVTDGVWTWFASILFTVILMLIATLKYCRKHLSKPKYESKNLSLLKKSLIVDDGDALGKIRLTTVKVEEFIRYCHQRRKHAIIDALEYDKTLENIGQPISFLIARQNVNKNQNQDVIAQDGNRVKLLGQKNDYINATKLAHDDDAADRYLDRAWIVTQGPMDNTIEDFWKLIWQQDTRLIVMLTKTFEVVRLMCSQYWPANKKSTETYGPFKVILEKEECFAHYVVRQFNLSHDTESKTVTQFHYTSWPLSAHPDSADLLHFRRHIRTFLDQDDPNAGPPLIHCHDGGGRSGTFLAIEANATMADTRGEVDVLGTVKWLHQQRAQLVSRPAFYRLIYDILEDYIKCGDTSLELEEMLTDHSYNLRETEFKTLASLRPQYTIGDCAAGHRSENRDKNRNVLVVPPDENRPYLTSFQSNSTTDYINAVFVDGFFQPKSMIVTEWPMLSTMANFWSMIYDHECSTIVVLNNPPIPGIVTRNNNKSFVRFWPEEGQASYGPVFSVQAVDSRVQSDFTSWQLRLGKKEIAPHRKFHALSMDDKKSSKKANNNSVSLSTILLQGLEAPPRLVRLYQINAWPQDCTVPESPSLLMKLLGDVQQWHGEVKENNMNSDGNSDHLNRTAVISCDGMSRVGVYCATLTSVEQVAATKKVDIFNAVKCTRKYRPRLVDSLEEYQYIHNTVKQFIINIS